LGYTHKPEAEDNIHIPNTHWIIFDEPEMPILDMLTIDGRLSFMETDTYLNTTKTQQLAADAAADNDYFEFNLNAKHIFVRGG